MLTRGRHHQSDPPGANGRPKRGAMLALAGVRVSKKAAVALLGASGLLALMGPDLSPDLFGRRLDMATTCIHNTYINSFEDATLMPAVPKGEENYVPVHVKMCYEWLRRDGLGIVKDKTVPKTSFLEHRDICLDWTAPHYAMMEILSNTIMQKLVPRMRYRHGCPSHREYEESLRGYDWSTLQTVFQEPAMAVDKQIVDYGMFLDQCKYCVEQHDAGAVASRVRSRAFHHCFAFPEDSAMYKDPYPIPEYVTEDTLVPLPSYPDTTKTSAPLAAVRRPLHARLFHSAAEWLNVTDMPKNEGNSGTVIIIDPGTLGIEPEILERFIDPQTTSIAILAGPLCYSAVLPTGEVCHDYGERVKAYFDSRFPNLATNGFEGGPGVDFQISASTAGLNSRAIVADDLLCPPRTASCLMPPLGKKPPTKATMLGVPCPDCPGTGVPEVKFFENVGKPDNVDIYLLPDPDRPPVTENTPQHPAPPVIPQQNPEVPVSPAFPDSQKPITGDGFPDDGSPVPAPVDVASLPQLPSYDAYKNVEPKLPPEVAAASTGDPNEPSPIGEVPDVLVDHSNIEQVPTPEEIQAAVDSGTPLDVNTPPEIPTEDGPEPVDPTQSTELATDESAGLVSRPMSDEDYVELAVERKESKDRIVTAFDGNYLFEVPCPAADDLNNAIITDDGYSIVDNGETVVVSDGQGTVTFDSPVTITTVPVQKGNITDPVTGLTTEEEFTVIHDPILDEDIKVTSGGTVDCNCDSSVRVTTEVGQLVEEPTTRQGCLLTGGAASVLKKKNTNEPKTHTLIEGTVVSAGNENVPPSDTGTVVMNADGSFAVTQQNNDFNGFLPIDPLDGNSGQYQHIINSPLMTSVLKVPWDQCQHQDFPNPIYIAGQFGATLMFDTYQTFKGGKIDWVAVGVTDVMYGGDYHCIKKNEVPYGPIKNSRRFAMCSFKNGRFEAEIDIFIRDSEPKINQLEGLPPNEYDITPFIPDSCESTQDYANKCKFKYRVDCMGGLPPSRRRRLAAMTPEGAVPKLTRDDERILFAKNILRQCPELGQDRVFDHFKFGGNAQNTRKIPVHVQGAEPVYPAKIARTFVAPSEEASHQ